MAIKYIVEDSIINPVYLIRESSVDWSFFRKSDGLRLIYAYFHVVYYPLEYSLVSPLTLPRTWLQAGTQHTDDLSVGGLPSSA